MTHDKNPLSMTHLLHEKRHFTPPVELKDKSHISSYEQYAEEYKKSIDNPNAFWLEKAKELLWIKEPTVACESIWDTKERHIEHSWFKDGAINVSENCLDRHLTTDKKQKPAIIWQGESDEEQATLTYEELHYNVCRFANVLKSYGIEKGDRVCIYLPMIPELAIAMLACARIGAIHTIVFGGFSSESLSHRINDCSCRLVITSNVSIRAGKTIPLKEITDGALKECDTVEKVIVVKRTGNAPCQMLSDRDVWWHDAISKVDERCSPTRLNSEDPLFILYTSGSTGKPKGLVHTQAGYLLYASYTHKMIFDVHDDDVYWCTADIGWITGHSYVIYGPLVNGATTVMFEGVPTYPDAGRFWEIVDKFQVTSFYTAPTAIRSLICQGEEFPKKYDLSSLRILGTVGEPINPEVWMWYHDVIGRGRCPIVDTWWQTETGGIMITPLPGCHTLKPGSASQPFFGIDPIILKDDGTRCVENEGGSLCIQQPWPGICRTMWGDHDRYIDTYFSHFDNLYFTGDGCLIDEEGDYWLMGRIDDVVNISGHRIGTAEVESALVSHDTVAEAAVVAIPDNMKGQGLAAYVTLVNGVDRSNDLIDHLKLHVRQEIGPIAIPDKIQFTQALPKTRSGKIMRRILRKIACGETSDLGDISTLADPQVIEDLLEHA